MKYDDLIGTLAADLQPARPSLRPEFQAAAFLLWTAAAVSLFLASAHGLSGVATARTVIALVLLTVAATAATVISAIPGRRTTVPVLFATVGLLLWLLEIAASHDADAWGDVPWIKCFRFTSGFGLTLALAWPWLLRRAWPVQPRLTTALALTAAVSAAALATTLDCASAASMHVLVGHFVPVLILTAFGAAIAARLSRTL